MRQSTLRGATAIRVGDLVTPAVDPQYVDRLLRSDLGRLECHGLPKEHLFHIRPVDSLVDMLICGSRGYGPIRRVLLGGVSSPLIRQAQLPVTVVPRAATGSAS
jgi:Universal stress protein family